VSLGALVESPVWWIRRTGSAGQKMLNRLANMM
jgi:hypothetical protein